MTVLHVLYSSLPLLSGYAVRTQHILKAQQRYCKAVGVTSPYYVAQRAVENIAGVTYYHAAHGESQRHASQRHWPVLTHRLHQRDFELVLDFLIQELHPDLIHGHSSHRASWPACRAASRRALPFVYEMRGLWEETAVAKGMYGRRSLRYFYHRRHELALAHKAQRVFVISESLRTEMLRRGVPETKLVVVSNGVTRHAETTAADETLRERHGLAHDFVLGYIGALNKYESLHLIIAAVARLRERGKSVKGVIVGEGPEKENLRACAQRYGVLDQILFLGPIAPEKVRAYYALIDVFVLARSETRVTQLVTPLKPFEAMAAGKCVLVSALPALQEAVQNEVTGLCFRPDDVEHLIAQCERLLHNETLRQKLGQAAREWVTTHRQWNNLVEIYREHYSQIL